MYEDVISRRNTFLLDSVRPQPRRPSFSRKSLLSCIKQFSVVGTNNSHQVPRGRPPLPQSTSSHSNLTNCISTITSTAPRFRHSSEDLTSLSRGGVVATSDNRPSVFGSCCCGAAVLTASFLPPYCRLSALSSLLTSPSSPSLTYP